MGEYRLADIGSEGALMHVLLVGRDNCVLLRHLLACPHAQLKLEVFSFSLYDLGPTWPINDARSHLLCAWTALGNNFLHSVVSSSCMRSFIIFFKLFTAASTVARYGMPSLKRKAMFCDARNWLTALLPKSPSALVPAGLPRSLNNARSSSTALRISLLAMASAKSLRLKISCTQKRV